LIDGTSVRLLRRCEEAQAALEYVIATGAVAVALAVGLFAFNELAPAVFGHSCPSVDTAASPGATKGSCVEEEP
jgi:hypothetical protein